MSNKARKRVNQAAREGRLAIYTRHHLPPFLRAARDLLGLDLRRPSEHRYKFTFNGQDPVRVNIDNPSGGHYFVVILSADERSEFFTDLTHYVDHFTTMMSSTKPPYHHPAGEYLAAVKTV